MSRTAKGGRGVAIFLVLLVFAFWWVGKFDSAASSPNAAAISAMPGAQTAMPPQQLSAESQAALHAIVQAGFLAELRWPDFSDYRQPLVKFYDSYAYSLPWIRGMQPTPQAQEVIALLLKADQKGLSAEDYDGSRWSARLAKLRPAAQHPTEEDALRFDAAMTVCVIRYISDLHIGKVNPRHFDFGIDVEAKKYDLPDFLKNHVVDGPNVPEVLAQVEPPYPGYRREIQALQIYMELARKDDGEQLPPVKKTVAPGDAYPGVPRLTRLLRLTGDLPADADVPAAAAVYQGPLVDAVKIFQRRHGLDPDGRIGAQTIGDLNVPLSRRVRQMQLTLERWLPLGIQKAPIVVNIPEFRLRAYDEHLKNALTMNVVVGKAYDHSTPIFIDDMEYVVFRPYWNVPYSIVKAELLPGISRDPDYLTKEGFDVVDNRENVIGSGPVTEDILQQLRAGKLFIRQKPGPKNSLGLVKFIFPNNYDVYMHDTPSTELFSKSRRDFSHGCVRLERPADMAAWVLRDNPGWNIERIRAAMNGEKTQQVNLAHSIPVLIVYGTAVVQEDGLVHFYDDIYGHDVALEKVLEKGYPYPG
jgi:murein L,D-transpeptidase YcbB/YkuD